jgi:hypothetical protein
VDFEKCADQEIQAIPAEAARALRNMGYSVRARVKTVQIFSRAIEIACYVAKDLKTGRSVSIQPDVCSPHRPYPVYVYLFAVAACELGGMAQRAAAAAAARAFGLPGFSASTVCRARKALAAAGSWLAEAARAPGGRGGAGIAGAVRAAMEGGRAPRPGGPAAGDLAGALAALPWLGGWEAGRGRPPDWAGRLAEGAGALCQKFYAVAGRLPV